MDKVKIGQFIAKCRKEQKLTQEQLAEKLGVSKNAVSKWERGICLMDMSLLKPLSELLQVSVIDILSGEKVEENKIKEKRRFVMEQLYTDKEVLQDALTAEKTATNNYNTYANECVHDTVREAILNCLSEEHKIQEEVFNAMHTRGLYPTPEAEDKKVDEAKQKFSCTYKSL